MTPTVWTGSDEDQWLGWLDEPFRELDLSAAPVGEYEHYVLLGMGGSSLAPEVFRRSFESSNFHVLDTTHPKAIRRLQESIDVDRSFFVASSKSGTTLETRSHLEHFWELAGAEPEQFAVVTDPGSELEALAQERGFRAIFHGEPTIGGRYSALSAFGLVAAALIGADLDRIRTRAREMAAACRGRPGQPGPPARAPVRRRLGGRARQDLHRRHGRRLRPVGRAADRRIDRQGGQGPRPGSRRVAGRPRPPASRGRLGDPYDLGAEFFRWEFATAVAGSILGINAFNQPDVQSAKDRTNQILGEGGDPDVEPTGLAGRAAARRRGAQLHLRSGLRRPDRRQREQARGARRSHPRPHRLRDDPRLRPSLPALDRPAAQGRPADRPLRPDRRRHRRRDRRSPARTSASGS